MTAALFAVAAGAGAATRLGVNQAAWRWGRRHVGRHHAASRWARFGRALPLVGTLVVNVVGAFLLGVLLASEPTESTSTVLGTGFLGALTTFSTFSLEASEGPLRRRALVVVATVVLGLSAAAAGHAVG